MLELLPLLGCSFVSFFKLCCFNLNNEIRTRPVCMCTKDVACKMLGGPGRWDYKE